MGLLSGRCVTCSNTTSSVRRSSRSSESRRTRTLTLTSSTSPSASPLSSRSTTRRSRRRMFVSMTLPYVALPRSSFAFVRRKSKLILDGRVHGCSGLSRWKDPLNEELWKGVEVLRHQVRGKEGKPALPPFALLLSRAAFLTSPFSPSPSGPNLCPSSVRLLSFYQLNLSSKTPS
jgi:hypothetical protein